MASRRELKTLITLAGRLDPSLEQAMLKAAGMGKNTSKKLTFWGTKLSLDLDKMGQASARWLKRAAVAGVAALGAGFVYLGKQGVELASDLEEVQNVVDVMNRLGRRRSTSASGCPWASWRCSVPSRR